jgi:hypothetical protein
LDFLAKQRTTKKMRQKVGSDACWWADSQLFKLLKFIFDNRGMELIAVNHAYNSMGLVKNLKMYGFASDEAGGLVMARRGMRLCQRIAGSLTAFVEVKLTQHVGNRWHQVNNKIKHSGMVTNRHTYYYISNGDFLANPERSLREAQPLGKNA